MANAATAGTAISFKHPYANSIQPIVISMDTVQSALTVKAAAGAGIIIAVLGGSLQNNHASGAQTFLFKSGTTEVYRQIVAASKCLNLRTLAIDSGADGGILGKNAAIFTQPNEALTLTLNDATNQPVNGVIWVATFDTNKMQFPGLL